MNVILPLSMGNWYDARLTLVGMQARQKCDRFFDVPFDRKKWLFIGTLDNSFKVGKNLSFELIGNIQTPFIQGTLDLASSFNLTAGMKWNFANDRCSLTARCSDISNSSMPDMKVHFKEQYLDMDSGYYTRTVSLNFTYRFGGYKKQKVNKPCNVVVVGAGTAGLEAACTAAEVGCKVTLLEKEKEAGGLSVEISKIPAKKRLADFPTYLKYRASKLPNLTIKTGVDATVAEIKKYNPDLVVNATGSVPLLPPIEGLHDNLGKKDASVYSIKDMIADVKNYPEDMTGKKVVVVGGGAVGLDVVEFFAPRGAETTIIEMMPVIGNGLDASSTSSMKECMEKHHVRQMTNTALQKVNAHSFLVKYDGKEEELPFDYGFVCLGMRANAPIWNDIQEAFTGEDVEVLNIGDSVRARRIIDGTDAGRHMVLNTLERLNYL